MVAVYNMDGWRSLVGVNVAVRVPGTTRPFTEPPTFVNVKVDEFTEAGTTASLNVAVITEFKGTFVAPLAGLLELTSGGVTSPPM